MAKILILYEYLYQEGLNSNLIQKLTLFFTYKEYEKGSIILNMGEWCCVYNMIKNSPYDCGARQYKRKNIAFRSS